MGAEIIEFRGRNKLGYSHVVCTACYSDKFHVRVTDGADGVRLFYSIVCEKCGNEIYVNMVPLSAPMRG